MKLRTFIYAALFAEIAVLGAAGAATTIVRPPCYSGSRAYLLAANAGAVIDVKDHRDQANGGGAAVVVFRPRKENGWASQRLLARFDLAVALNDKPVVVRNSGQTCRAPH